MATALIIPHGESNLIPSFTGVWLVGIPWTNAFICGVEGAETRPGSGVRKRSLGEAVSETSPATTARARAGPRATFRDPGSAAGGSRLLSNELVSPDEGRETPTPIASTPVSGAGLCPVVPLGLVQRVV